jgi:hypothetical protein
VSSADQCIVEPLWKVNYLEPLGNTMKKNGTAFECEDKHRFLGLNRNEIVSSE